MAVKRNHPIHRLVVAVLAFGAMSAPAFAGGFGIHEQSAEFQGTSFAGVAAGGHGLSSMFWNPATVTRFSGVKSDYNASLILPYSRAKNQISPLLPPGTVSDSGNIGKTAVVPATYTSIQITDMIWAGLSVTSPFGMKTENRADSIGALFGYKSKILTFNVSPAIGIKINDAVSFAAGLQVNYMKGDLSNIAPLTTNIATRIKGDDWGLGFTVGLHFAPVDGTEIGIGYRSRIKHKLKGDFYAGPIFGGPSTNKATVRHTLPDIATLSIRQQVTDQFILMGTVEWTNWSLFKNLDVEPVAGFNPPPQAYNWKDGWLLAVGGEYAVSETLSLRAGYAYEKSPVPDSTRGVRVPDNDRHWLSAGLTYTASDWLKVHAAYTHIFIKDGDVNFAPVMVASYNQNVDIISVGATIDTGKLFFGN